ncbi:MAG: DUF87 domain-containing protein [Oscillospiraceae bacterium]|nr:DUF87 domain-containing protein [Oscillospiraceae bacterium]
MDERNFADLYAAFESADFLVLKKYVNELERFRIYDEIDEIKKIPIGSNLCLHHIEKIVYDVKENIHDKLTTVYSSLYSDKETALVLLLNGTENGVDIYIGAANRNVGVNGTVLPKTIDNMGNAFEGIMEGHFPGTVVKRINGEETKKLIEKCFSNVNAIAAVSGIAALRNQNEAKNEEFVQGMEKLIDSMRGKTYTAVYLADVMSASKIESLCSTYEDIYSNISPFKQSVRTRNESDASTGTTGTVEGVVNTINKSIAKATSHSTSESKTKTHTVGGGVSYIASINYNYSNGKTNGKTDGKTKTNTFGKALSKTSQSSFSNAFTKTKGESLQITYDNRAVQTLLERIDEQIHRLRSCEDFGIFDSCVYFLSNKYENAVAAASTYKSMVRGENSSVESSAINVWTDKERIGIINEYLTKFYHPLFAINDYMRVTPAMLVSGNELSYQFSLPKKSVSGLPVISCAEFGRNVMTVDGKGNGDLDIGKIYHMHHTENSDVEISSDALTAHTFITGSTGSGKSNAVYQLLDKLTEDKKRTFMVVEPAKGEYKDVFGNRKDVFVYGSNPQLTQLLRINPFRFPSSTHIYEHMDKLVEIFNVCWPMYAAMPAVLKAALENAYISAGWDLTTSCNVTGTELFPTFSSVAAEVKKYIDSSEYSEENKSNYKGALLTRLESMTNGINGMIFSADDISDEDLFDKNVIVDLSRIGSVETKALIMGILVMRMQEYRAGTCLKNSKLKHITVLEEAHNLLKRTSTEQSTEGANLVGKSVEMLANSIAEMRTYGEAFMIVDQAPGLLDMSVIRNTNTKIILRLPDHSDRVLVGRAANLNEEQINELSKLKTGIAAVYQNNWINPVLCQFEKFKDEENVYFRPDRRDYRDKAPKEILNVIMKDDIRKKLDDVDYERKIRHDICVSKLPDSLKVLILKYLNGDKEKTKAKYIAEIAYKFFDAESIFNRMNNVDDMESWKQNMIAKLLPDVKDFAEAEISRLLAMLLHEHYLAHNDFKPLYLSYMEHIDNSRNLG